MSVERFDLPPTASCPLERRDGITPQSAGLFVIHRGSMAKGLCVVYDRERPFMYVFAALKAPWLTTSDDLPQFVALPP